MTGIAHFVNYYFFPSFRPIMDFTDQMMITSDSDLIELLKECPKCFKTSLNGKLIMFHEDIQSLNVKHLRHQKLCIIINSEKGDEKLGHWVALLISKLPSNLVTYMDSLNMLKNTKPAVHSNIIDFCKLNNLNVIDRSFKWQRLNQNSCGYYSLYILAKFVHLSHNAFEHFLDALKRNPNSRNEYHIFKFVVKHFS